ncbi:MAG: glycosyltransferase [Pseudomonadota bacterium]
MRVAYFTICSANYLAYARTLHASLAKADPKAAEDFHLILVDELDEATERCLGGLNTTEARALDLPTFFDMALRYDQMEMNTAVKPAAFEHLFSKGYDAAIYLDPDIYVLKPLTHVLKALKGGANGVLTPHATAPLEDGLDPDDVRLMRTGVFNLGFGAFANTKKAKDFVAWWKRRMEGQCRVDLENGLFVDQRFMDLAPAYLDDLHVLKHLGYNTAYWNLGHRPVKKSPKGWTSGGQPLHFFHFSGVKPGNKKVFSKHQNRFGVEDIGELNELLGEYLDELDAQGHAESGKLPYTYGRLADGAPVPKIIREIFADDFTPAPRTREEAFSPDLAWADAPAESLSRINGFEITKVMHAVWRKRPDLRDAFPLTNEQGRERFLRWFAATAEREYGLPKALIAKAEAQLAAHGGGVSPFSNGRGVSPKAPIRWVASKALTHAGALRKAYQIVPPRWRAVVRDGLIRSASGQPTARRIAHADDRFMDRGLAPGLGVYGYFRAVSGVGEGARRTIGALQAVGAPFSAHIVSTTGHQAEIVEEPASLAYGPSPHRALLFHVNADQTPMMLDATPREELQGRYLIGYWTWELAEFPDAWAEAFSRVDEVWTPTRFVRDAVAAKTDKPVHVVPHPVPERISSGEGRARLGLPADRFLFLCALDLNSYRARKNAEGAYKAFRRAFPEGCADGPMLVVKVHGGAHTHDARRELASLLAKDDCVILIDLPMDGARYAALQEACDAYVSLHRSEGFGLNIAECMRLGRPVVATGYGGNADFLDETTGYPVPYEMVAVKPGEYPHGEGQKWAEPDLEAAAAILREIANDPNAARARGEAARRSIIEAMGPDKVGAVITRHLQRIDGAYFEPVAEAPAASPA